MQAPVSETQDGSWMEVDIALPHIRGMKMFVHTACVGTKPTPAQ
jgi:hypothetical protein